MHQRQHKMGNYFKRPISEDGILQPDDTLRNADGREDMFNRPMVVWHTVKTRVCSIQAGRRPFIRRSFISLDAILCLSSLNWTTCHFLL